MKTAIIMLSVVSFTLFAGLGTVQADGTSGTLAAQVDTVTLAQSEGEDSTISVVDESGVTILFYVTAATVISGPIGEPISLGNINQNDPVEIEYDNLEGGVGLAKSVKLTE
ncbi:MAG: hypothetical protein PHX64_04985 [Candidatus Omnitrophica bacterium]|nr:hypothetical protein [Candidatus Omnitrophota bacterium]